MRLLRLNEWTHIEELLPTLEMVNGVLKSRPPTSRKPQGEGPFSVTVWGMFGIWTASGGNRQMTGRQSREVSAVPRREKNNTTNVK